MDVGHIFPLLQRVYVGKDVIIKASSITYCIWYKNTKRLLHVGNTLFLRRVKLKSSGIYTCRGTNEMGTRFYNASRLIVARKCVLYSIIGRENSIVSPSVLRVNTGESAKFHCDMKEAEWFVKIPNCEEYNASFTDTLQLELIGKVQEGTYYCIGLQKNIPTMGQVRLIVYGKFR